MGACQSKKQASTADKSQNNNNNQDLKPGDLPVGADINVTLQSKES